MKQFMPTYLYIKTHNVTGLKYFGKTTGDPERYRGSGKYWLAHIKKYGYDVTTEIFGYYIDKEECIAAATQFSKDNDIVFAVNESNKKVWANQIIENGIDGGATGRTIYNPHSEESKKKMSVSRKGSIPWNKGKIGVTPGNKKPKTDEQRQKISKSLTGRKRDPEIAKKTADKLRGRKRPEISKMLKGIKKSEETKAKMKLAQQNKGPVSEETKEKIRESRKHQIFTEETKEKLKGMVVVVNKDGQIKRITKEEFYSQDNSKSKEWVFHNSIEGKLRKAQNNSKEISSMRR